MTVGVLLPALNAVAEQYKYQGGTLSLDTGYKTTEYSNRAITDFNMEMLQGYGYLNNAFYNWQDKVGKNDSTLSKSLWETANIGVGIILSGVLTRPVHEFGHGSRAAAAGATTPIFGYTNDSTTNIFSYYTLALKYSFRGLFVNGTTTFGLSTQTKYLNLSALEQSKIDFLIIAGGMNTEMYTAEEMSNLIYDKGGHVSYLVPYLASKNNSYFYTIFAPGGSNDDIANMVTYYNSVKGYNITVENIKNDNLIALFASGTTYSIFGAYYNYLNNDDPTVKLLSYKNIRWPDVHLYYTTKGMSYKLDSAYQVNDSLSIPFSVERVYRGESYTESSIGWKKSFSKWLSSGKIFVSDKVSSQISIGYQISIAFDIFFGWDHYNQRTLFGERHTLDLYEESSDEIWSKVSWKY